MVRWRYIALVWVMTVVAGAAAQTYAQRLRALQAKLALNPTNTTVLLRLGRLCHDEGGKNDKQAVKLAERYFKRLLALDPTNALGRVYYGSTLTMKARDAFWPFTRMHYAHQGLKQMDAAVKLAPTDPHVRFARAINNIHMPKYMGREKIAARDFAWLWKQVRTKPKAFDAVFKQNVALFEGRILWKKKPSMEAVQVWRQGLAFAPQTVLATQLKQELARAGALKKTSDVAAIH